MAKKKAGGSKADRQQQFEGDGFPDPPPKDVLDARDEYVSAMRSSARATKKKAEKQERLIEEMEEKGLKVINLL